MSRNLLTRDFLISEIKRFIEEHGEPPRYREIPHKKAVIREFGSLKNALCACGVYDFAKPRLDGWPRNDRMLNGYRVIYKPEHFCCIGGSYDGYVYEHKYKIELKIGRALRKNEVVHHKDGNRLNNDIGNLMLMTRSDHVRFHNLGCDESLLTENEDGSFSCKPPAA